MGGVLTGILSLSWLGCAVGSQRSRKSAYTGLDRLGNAGNNLQRLVQTEGLDVRFFVDGCDLQREMSLSNTSSVQLTWLVRPDTFGIESQEMVIVPGQIRSHSILTLKAYQ